MFLDYDERCAISLSSKRHSTTDDSTTAAELTQLHLCSCEVMGLRNWMDECGLHQELPTIIFQDNKPAVQIALNRGALSKKTRSMSLHVLSVRNKIEDGFIYPELNNNNNYYTGFIQLIVSTLGRKCERAH